MVEDGALTDRQTITLRSRARADTDQVLAARTGEATLIAGGQAERVGVIHAAVAAETHSRAGALLSAGGPLHPPGGPACRPPSN
jgi:predicted alpha/beta-hydrolase family hydrolase